MSSQTKPALVPKPEPEQHSPAQRALQLHAALSQADDEEAFLREHLNEFDDAVLDIWRQMAQAVREQGEKELADELDVLIQSIEQIRVTERQKETPTNPAVVVAAGDTLFSEGKIEEALEQYQKAYALFEQAGDRLRKAKMLKSIGGLLCLQNNVNEGLEHYHRALALFEKEDHHLGQAQTLLFIGHVLNRYLGNRHDALGYYQRAEAYFSQVGNRKGQASALLGIGELLYLQNKREKSQVCYKKALRGYRKTPPK